jgi:serine phosphatase RsbU (regulator of sigma subunit)
MTAPDQDAARVPEVDHAAVFDALTTPYLVLSPELVILGANRAYQEATGRGLRDLVGLDLFEAFPDDPDDPEARATANLRSSLQRTLRTGRADTMPVQRYNIPTADGGFEERWWSPVNMPVLDADGEVLALVHRVEDVTSYMRELAAAQGSGSPAPDQAMDPADPAIDVYLRGHELRDALTEESVAALRLNGLVEVARQLGAADDLGRLVEVVIERGLRVLGADGGAVGVSEAESLGLTVTASLGPQVERIYDQMPLHGPMPAAVAARTGRPVLLPDRGATIAWDPAMEEVVGATGMVAWACLPLVVGARCLGSLSIGWRAPQTFSERDLQLMEAFAALCAQALHRIRTADEERRRVDAERAVLTELQLTLLAEPCRPEGVGVAVRYLPSSEHARIGGDWYDSFIVPPGVLNVVIGDVTGHDRQAAAAMSQLRNMLRGVSVILRRSPAAALTGLEQAMRTLEVHTLATAVLAQVELEPRAAGERRLTWSNAGHLPPVLLHPDGRAELLRSRPEMLLGVTEANRTDHQAWLPPGAALLLYTDGLVEHRALSVQDGLDQLVAAVTGQQDLSAEQLAEHVLRTFHGRHDDDIALLVVRPDP